MKLGMMICGLLMPAGLMMNCSKDSSDDDTSTAPEVQEPGPGSQDPGLQDPTALVLDDFKTCSTDFKTAMDTYWYSFDDVKDGGKSDSNLTLGTPLVDGGACTLQWTGRVTTDFLYGFAGLGLDLGSTTLSGYKSLVFKVRGDGASYRLKLPMASQIDRGEFNSYGADMNCGDGSANWKMVTIDLATLQQEQGWGVMVPWDLGNVSKIQLQTKSQPILAFNCEIGALSLAK